MFVQVIEGRVSDPDCLRRQTDRWMSVTSCGKRLRDAMPSGPNGMFAIAMRR